MCRIVCERDGKGIEKGILEEEVEEVQLLQATAMMGGGKVWRRVYMCGGIWRGERRDVREIVELGVPAAE